MNTIRETLVAALVADGEEVSSKCMDTIESYLQERENEMADTIRELSLKFGLMPPIVAKTLMHVGLGTYTDEMCEHVDAQYEEVKRQVIEQAEQQAEQYRQQGFSVQVAEFEDPFAESAKEE